MTRTNIGYDDDYIMYVRDTDGTKQHSSRQCRECLERRGDMNEGPSDFGIRVRTRTSDAAHASQIGFDKRALGTDA